MVIIENLFDRNLFPYVVKLPCWRGGNFIDIRKLIIVKSPAESQQGDSAGPILRVEEILPVLLSSTLTFCRLYSDCLFLSIDF
jgi:hypothetical protein